jgi:8-oxo-dGTP pyrophosphatase MutT (NUDIX family)
MKRTALINLLSAYNPLDAEEKISKNRMLAFVAAYPDCFERSLAIGHVTASAWIINQDNSRALLMHHAKLGRWVQLGGHCDGESDVLAVALKEAQEESGIMHIVPVSTAIFDIDIHTIPANAREAEHDHYDVRFLLQVRSNEAVIQNNESKELRWISRRSTDLPTNSDSVVRMFTKWLNY